MTVFFDVDVLSRRVRVELPDGLDPQFADRARSAWSGAMGESGREAELTVPMRLGAGTADDLGSRFDHAMERLTVDVTLAALDSLRGRMLMFHAAGVADPSGRVAAFVGPSGRGKTTLSRELGRHHAYVSDETVAVGAGLLVEPYRKPLSVVRGSAPKQQVSPDEAGLRALPDAPLRLASLVLIDRDAALETPEIHPVPLVDAMPELVPQMSYLRDLDRPLQAIAALCDAVGGVRRVRYPDATTVPALLPQLLGGAAGVSADSEWSPAPDTSATGPFHTDQVKDAIVTGSHVMAMTNDTVHVLDGIAPTIWLTACAGADLDRIVERVEAEFGAPPNGDARRLVLAAIDQLLTAGLLGEREPRS